MKKFLEIVGAVIVVITAGATVAGVFANLGGVAAMERRMGLDSDRHYLRSSCRDDGVAD